MDQSSKAFYRERYLEVVHDGEDPVELVNSLAERLMRNDSQALDIVFRVMNYKFYDKALNYAKRSNMTSDFTDEILTRACMDFSILCASGKGLRDSVLEKGVYGLLSCTVKYAYLHVMGENKKYSENTSFGFENAEILEIINAKNEQDNNSVKDVLDELMNQEEKFSDKKVLDFFRQALIDNKEIPYQIITYCYTSLLPLMFKESHNSEFRENINIMSARGEGNSWYKNGKIGGDINRNSFILLNWALESMKNETTEKLSKEFEELYQQEPIIGMPFSWGKSYLLALNKEKGGKKIKDIIITDEFEPVRIKNWSSRVGKRLYEDTKRRMCQDKEFRKSAVGRAEKIIFELIP